MEQLDPSSSVSILYIFTYIKHAFSPSCTTANDHTPG